MSYYKYKFMKKTLLLLFISMLVRDLSAQNENLSNGQYFDGEPYMVIDPHNSKHIVVAWIGFTVGSPTGIKTKVSFDGGNSWSASVFLPHTNPSFPSLHSADPSICFDTAGYVYACYIDFHEAPDTGGVYVVRSPDGGLTWGSPNKVMTVSDDGAKKPLDRPWFCINPVNNHFYVTTKPAPWVLPPNRPYFRTSSDGGVTWAPWRYIDTTGHLVGNLISAPMAAPTVGSDGIFHCMYPSYLSSQNVLPGYIHASSANDGATFTYNNAYFSATTAQDSLAKLGYHLAIDPTNPQHLVFNFLGKPSGDLDIYMIQSSNGGTTWSSPQRVNDDPIGNGKMQDMTWCSFDVNGDLIVGWRDRRDAPGSGYSQPSETWGTILRKDSSNFSANFKISDTLAQFVAQYLDTNGNDFLNINLHQDTVYAVWGDTRTGVLQIWFNKKGIQGGSPSGILLTDEAIPAVSTYPNPSQNILYLKGENVTEVLIYNMTGQLVTDEKITSQQINTSALVKGVYNIQFRTAKGNTTQRFVKD